VLSALKVLYNNVLYKSTFYLLTLTYLHVSNLLNGSAHRVESFGVDMMTNRLVVQGNVELHWPTSGRFPHYRTD